MASKCLLDVRSRLVTDLNCIFVQYLAEGLDKETDFRKLAASCAKTFKDNGDYVI